MLKQVQKAHRTGRFIRGSTFFGVFSKCHTGKVTDDHPYSLQLHADLCICPWAPTMPCNTRGGDLTAAEKLEWWAIRGFPRHLTGTSWSARQTRERGDAMKIRAALSEGGAAGKEIGFPYNLLPGAK